MFDLRMYLYFIPVLLQYYTFPVPLREVWIIIADTWRMELQYKPPIRNCTQRQSNASAWFGFVGDELIGGCSWNKKINLIWIALWEWAIQLNYLLISLLPKRMQSFLGLAFLLCGWVKGAERHWLRPKKKTKADKPRERSMKRGEKWEWSWFVGFFFVWIKGG